MKRLFTLAIVALIATMAFAQSQQAQRRVPYTSVERAMQVGLLGPQAHADAVAKANAATEVGASRLVRGTNQGARFEQVSLNDILLSDAKVGKIAPTTRYSAPAKTVETEGNLTITKDENGIITNVEGVAPQYYKRSEAGQAFYYSSDTKITTQSGYAIIVIDGNNVYMLNPVSRYEQGTWVKGVKDGDNITVATHQPLAYNSNYGTTLSLRWGAVTAEGSISNDDDYAEAFTFAVNGDVLTLQGSSAWDGTEGIHFMGIFWDDDNTSTGYGDAGTVLTLDNSYTPPSTTLVELPEGVTAEGWYLNGTKVTSSTQSAVKDQAVNVAFDGNDVYVQGIFADFPTSWVKGTKNGNVYEFDNLQFIGTYSSYNIWMIGVDDETSEMVAPKAAYDATAKTLTFDCSVLANAASDRVYYLAWLADVVLSADEVEFEEPVLNTQTATLPYLNTFNTEEEMDEVAIYDANEDQSTFSFVQEGNDNIAARYRYNTQNVADDYLVFPNVQLEAGKQYVVSADVHSYSERYPEIVTILCGKESKASALTIEVVEPTTVAAKEYFTVANNSFEVAESGLYSFAVKAISEPDQFYLYVDNFTIKEVNFNAPATPEDLTITPDATGACKATVTVTAPSKDLKGDALTGNLNMVLKVDGVETVTKSVAAGAAVSEEITVATPGTYTVTVLFSYDGGIADPAIAKAYIGVDKPTSVTDLNIIDKSTIANMSWKAPQVGVNEGVFFPDQLTYNIYPVELVEFLGTIFPSVDTENPYATGVTATSYDVPFNTNEGEMQFSYLAVAALNEAGEGAAVYKGFVTGAPYTLPVKESCANKTLSYWWATNSDDDNYYADGGLYFGENPSDEDGYNFQFVGMTAGFATVESGKIALAGAANPVVQFDAVNTLGNAKLEVSVLSPEGEAVVGNVTPTSEYATYTISLVDYKNADWVRVVIKGVFEGEANPSGDPIAVIDVDNIKIVNLLDKNLCVSAFNVPAKVNAGNDLVATVTVENQGALAAAAADYTVKFTFNGEEKEVAGVDLAADQKHTFECTVPTSVAGVESFTVKAEVVYAADEDLSNNASAEVTVKVAMPKYPTVANVNAVVDGTTVTLTWDEPNLENLTPDAVTEDFEAYEPFQFGNAIGEWTLVDGDGAAMGGFQNLDIPNLVVGETTGSYFVMNVEDEAFNETFNAHSGVQYVATMFSYDGMTGLDDWLISPALPGDAQTISFFAKSYSASYAESFEVLYSTTDMAIESFEQVGEGVVNAPDTWTEYAYDLPEGAKYFAIHCSSVDKFLLLVDDITYIPANGASADLEIVGYNVYRDGAKVNAEPVAETNFVDADLADQTTYLYAVSAVYTQGESKAVEAQNGATTGIKQVDVENGEAIYYNMQGVQIAKPAAGTTCIRVINGKAVKVIIR